MGNSKKNHFEIDAKFFRVIYLVNKTSMMSFVSVEVGNTIQK